LYVFPTIDFASNWPASTRRTNIGMSRLVLTPAKLPPACCLVPFDQAPAGNETVVQAGWPTPHVLIQPPGGRSCHACISTPAPVGSGPFSAFGGKRSPPTASMMKSGPSAAGPLPPANARSVSPVVIVLSFATRLAVSTFGSTTAVAPSLLASWRRYAIGSTATLF